MEIIPIASDSIGVRSFSVFIRCEKMNIIIDPGIDLSPDRFGLPPHKREIERFLFLKKRINEYINASDVIIITHFHHDHFSKDFVPIYKGKILIIKDFRNVNYMQQKRSKEITDIIKDYHFGDGKEFSLKDVKFIFSKPLPHGKTPATVISVLIEEKGFKFLYSSDISGPVFEEQTDFIVSMKPDFLIIDGPPLYIDRNLKKIFLKELEKILNFNPFLIIDHHLSREQNFRDEIKEINFETFASFNKSKEEPLESMRKKMWMEC